MRYCTSVDIITHEEIVALGYLSSNLEKLHQVMELPMDVSTHNDGSSDRYDIGLFCKDFLGLGGGVCTFSQRTRISASGSGLQERTSLIWRSMRVWSMMLLEAM